MSVGVALMYDLQKLIENTINYEYLDKQIYVFKLYKKALGKKLYQLTYLLKSKRPFNNKNSTI